MKADQERVRALLQDTISLLCRNGLLYATELKIEGVLGITVDKTQVFIVHIDETLVDRNLEEEVVSLDPANSNASMSCVSLTQQALQSKSEQRFPNDVNTFNVGFKSSHCSDTQSNERRRSTESLDRKSDISVKSEPTAEGNDVVNLSDSSCTPAEPGDLIDKDYDDALIDMRGVHSSTLAASATAFAAAFGTVTSRDLKRRSFVQSSGGQLGFRPKSRRTYFSQASASAVEYTRGGGSRRRPTGVKLGDFLSEDNRNISRPSLASAAINMDGLRGERIGVAASHEGLLLGEDDIAHTSYEDISANVYTDVTGMGASSKPSRPAPPSRWYVPSELRHSRLAYRCTPRRHSFGSNKDYVCSVSDCGKSFYQKRNLLRHQRIKHQGAKKELF